MTLIRLTDLFRYGRRLLFPDTAVSPYRYVEHLVELSLVKKYRSKTILEIGPGSEPFLRHMDLTFFESVTLLDYQHEFVTDLARTLSESSRREVAAITADADKAADLSRFKEQWDCIIANALLEHLKYDQSFVHQVENLLLPGGFFAGTTVLSPHLYNMWDHAVGHYRRYSKKDLKKLFGSFHEVQVIQTSLIQELIRPLFFSRIGHLTSSTLEENNTRFNEEHRAFGLPPCPLLYGLFQKMFPLYLLFDWAFKDLQGGIAIIIARKKGKAMNQ